MARPRCEFAINHLSRFFFLLLSAADRDCEDYPGEIRKSVTFVNLVVDFLIVGRPASQHQKGTHENFIFHSNCVEIEKNKLSRTTRIEMPSEKENKKRKVEHEIVFKK